MMNNEAKMMLPEMFEIAFSRGFGTLEISKLFAVPEHEVYNALAARMRVAKCA